MILNTFEKNKINNPSGRGIVLSGSSQFVYGNLFAFNDLRGSYDEIWYSDPSLLTANTFDRNLGSQSPDQPNRGVGSN